MAKPDTTVARLNDPETLDALCADVVGLGSVAAACKKNKLDIMQVWRTSRKPGNEALHDALWSARQAAAEARWDECIGIADAADPVTTHLARLQIDTRMRVAGKMMQSVYGEQVQPTTSIVNNVGIVCDEATRARLIELRERITLADRKPALLEDARP